MRKLTPAEIMVFTESSERLIMTTPDCTEFRVYGVNYHEPLYSFRKGLTWNECIEIDTSIPDIQVFEEAGTIHFLVNDETWILKELDFAYFIKHEYHEEEILEKYQAKLCIERAYELSSYLNKQLLLNEDKMLEIVVDLQAKIEYLYDIPDCSDIVTHHFRVSVIDKNDNLYAGGMLLYLETTNEDALRFLARDLVENLVPVNERHKNSAMYWMDLRINDMLSAKYGSIE